LIGLLQGLRVLIPENSLSNADAVTEICELSLKRLAVSFTTAKASGRMSSSVFSDTS
jgi:hypothetical protein